MLIILKPFEPEVWMWISALALVRHLLNRDLKSPLQLAQAQGLVSGSCHAPLVTRTCKFA